MAPGRYGSATSMWRMSTQSVASIEQAGGKVLMAALDIPNIGRSRWWPTRTAAPFYIMKPTPPADQPNAESDVFSVDQPQHVRWNELSTTDQDGAIDFYKRQFGWSQEGAMPMGEMGDYKFIHANGVRIGAIMRKPPQLPVSLWTYYIGVDDIDRAAGAIKNGGGQILHGTDRDSRRGILAECHRPAGRQLRARRSAQELKEQKNG